MLSATFKESHNGQGIYWHHAARMYGDETVPRWRTLRDARVAIDASVADRLASRPEWEHWWDTVDPVDRCRIRRAYATTPGAWDNYESAAHFGWLTR